MHRTVYAAGVAILATLLLSSAFGAAIEWVDVDGSAKPAGTIALPPGTEARIQPAFEAHPPDPPPRRLYAMPLDYVYIWPPPNSIDHFPWVSWYDGVYYGDFRFQMLYPASDIGRSGTIAQLALWATFYDYEGTFPNTSVKLCHTPLNDLTLNFNDNYGGNAPVWVYHNDAFHRGGDYNVWDTVELTTPFEYNGTDNLLVEVTWIGTESVEGVGPGCWAQWPSPNLRRAYAYNITDTLIPTAKGVDHSTHLMRIGFFKEGTPDPWTGDMLTQGYWKNHPCYDPKHPDAPYIEEYLPLTIAGEEVNTVPEALAIFDPPKPMTAWKMFLIQFLAAKLNAGWQTDPSLINAWYDYPGGDYPFDNQRVYGVFEVADDYRSDTDKATLNTMMTVLYNMNNYSDKDNSCLWDAMWSPGTGPQGGATALPMKPELSVVPSVVKDGNVRIAYGLPKAAPAQLSVLDITGRTVMTRGLPAAVGDNVITLDTRSWGAGVYILKLRSDACDLTQKVVIE